MGEKLIWHVLTPEELQELVGAWGSQGAQKTWDKKSRINNGAGGGHVHGGRDIGLIHQGVHTNGCGCRCGYHQPRITFG